MFISGIKKELPYIVILLLACALLYYPGLGGTFLFDDYINLAPLEGIKDAGDWQNIFAYSLNGISSTLGRPLSLITFAFQAEDWIDNNPFGFKLVNLAIHLTNGLLVYLLTIKLLRPAFPHNRSVLLYSLLASAVWLLHPLQVSTVLYAVQRMTELSALFTLAGILLYLHGRSLSADHQWKRSWFYMTAGMTVGLLLGILSKENAILICLYIAAMEWTILASSPRPKQWNLWAAVCLATPILALAVYLAPSVISHLDSNYPNRDFDAITRLLTESRIIMDYIGSILLPRPSDFGLFHSDYQLSTSLLQPLSTLFSTLTILSLLAYAAVARRSQPLIAFGILWFFAGHALESTALSLELYFEHRNYLPIFGVAMTVTGLLVNTCSWLQQKSYFKGKRAIAAGAALWLIFLGIITFNEVKLWGNPVVQAASWAQQFPNSFRTQGHYALLLIRINRFQEAREFIEKHLQHSGEDASHILLWLNMRCHTDTIEPPDDRLLSEKLAATPYRNAYINILDTTLNQKQDGKCEALDNAELEKVITLLKNNKHYQAGSVQHNIHRLLAKLYMIEKKYAQVLQEYNTAYALKPTVDTLITVADIHLMESNREWYLQTVGMINNFCTETPVKCLPHQQRIEAHNAILVQINEQRQ